MFQLCNEYNGSVPKNVRVEIKYDGMNIIYKNGLFINRRFNNVGFQFPEIKIHSDCEVLGEICVFVNSKSSFNHLLSRSVRDSVKISVLSKITCEDTFK